MIPSPQISLTPESAAFIAGAREWPRTLTRNLVRALREENEYTVGHIKQARLTGKGPFPPAEGRLGVRSNFLRRSLRQSDKPAVVGTAIYSSIGTNMAYAGGHEFGFSGTVQVRAHPRRIFGTFTAAGGTSVDARTGKVRKQRKREVELQTGTAQVRAHAREVNIPERAPIRRGIADRALNYRDALSTAIVVSFNPPA